MARGSSTIFPKILSSIYPALVFSVIFGTAAEANILDWAKAGLDCSGYRLKAVATDLAPGVNYTIDYGFSVTAHGASTPFAGTINFTAAASEATATGVGSWDLTADRSTVSGSATLTSSGSTVAIIVNGSKETDGSAGLNCKSGSWSQDGPKLVGKGAITGPGVVVEQGNSVWLAGDGRTAVAGGPGDDDGVGALWVFVQRGGAWRPQGGKLVGTGAVGAAAQGYSVAVSAAGDTALAGGPLDNAGSNGATAGAAWVFARVAGVWQQQAKLVAADAAGLAEQGWSVALSADGNTALVGGPGDDDQGAAWVFTRTSGVWRQAAKLVGSGAVGNASQGTSVALSGDGNTAMIGGPRDGAAGAAWVFVRTAGVWQQQGAKLVGSGAVGDAFQGTSVALSADGNTAIVGGPRDAPVGAAWVFGRSGATWQQEGPKLVGRQAIGNAKLGNSVSLSADGSTAVVGGFADSGGVGAAWAFRNAAGVWQQTGPKLVGTGTVGAALVGASVSLSQDGSTVVIGGPGDARIGAVRIFGVANPVPAFSGTPGKTDCYGTTATALVRQFHGLAGAAAGLGYPGIAAMQNAALRFCQE